MEIYSYFNVCSTLNSLMLCWGRVHENNHSVYVYTAVWRVIFSYFLDLICFSHSVLLECLWVVIVFNLILNSLLLVAFNILLEFLPF